MTNLDLVFAPAPPLFGLCAAVLSVSGAPSPRNSSALTTDAAAKDALTKRDTGDNIVFGDERSASMVTALNKSKIFI